MSEGRPKPNREPKRVVAAPIVVPLHPTVYNKIPDRVTIVLMSAIGDVTLGMPVATALKRARPDVRITWVAQPGPSQLLATHPAVDRVIPFDRRGGWRAYRDVRARLQHEGAADVLLDLQVAMKAGFVTALAPARDKWGFDKARTLDLNWAFTNRKLPAAPRRHMADQFLEFLAPFGVNAEPLDYGLRAIGPARQWREAFTAPFARPYATLVIASSAARKNWVPERWAEIADTLYHDYGVQPVIAGGDSDVEAFIANRIRDLAKAPIVSALGSGIANLIALLDGAELVIAPDTGPMHLGIALGRPVIALYGATNPKWVGPYRRCHDLLVDRYGDEGEDYPITPARREGRMQRITVDDVKAKLAAWNSDYRV